MPEHRLQALGETTEEPGRLLKQHFSSGAVVVLRSPGLAYYILNLFHVFERPNLGVEIELGFGLTTA
jgi:hypothetical protein